MKNQEPHAAELSEVIAAANVNGKAVTSAFASYIDQIEEWREKAMALKVTSADQTQEMAEARMARLALKNIRVAADKLRKDMKAEPMAYCNTVQAVFNDIEARIKPIEAHLQQQEEFAERQRAEELAAIRAHREAAFAPFSDFVAHGIDWGLAAEADFERMLAAASIAKRVADEKMEAEEQAERDARALRIQCVVDFWKARASFGSAEIGIVNALMRGEELLEALIYAAAVLNQTEGPDALEAHRRAVEVLESLKEK